MNSSRRLLVLVLSLIFSGLASAQTAPGSSPGWIAQLPQCKDAWSKLIPKGGHLYNYAKDANITDRGNEGYATYAARVNRTQCRKPWTVLVYMAADNDLGKYAMMDLYEMEAGFAGGELRTGSTLRSDLVVQLDTSFTSYARRLHIFQTPEAYNPKLTPADYDTATEVQVRSPIVQAQDLTSLRQTPTRDFLRDFLRWGIRQYPADHYAVIVWGHGQGFGAGRLQGLGGVAVERGGQSRITVPELASVLQETSQADLEGHPIDLLAEDACLMQSIEVIAELSPHARFVTGSAQSQNFLGLPYRRTMYELNSGHFNGIAGSDEPLRLAAMIPQVFFQSMAIGGSQGRQIKSENPQNVLSLSSIDTNMLTKDFLPKIGAVGQSLARYLQEVDAAPWRKQRLLQYFAPNPGNYAVSELDLGGFLSILQLVAQEETALGKTATEATRELSARAAEASQALRSSIVGAALGKLYQGKVVDQQAPDLKKLGYLAVSAWIPPDADPYGIRVDDMSASKFFEVSSWKSWMDLLYAP